MTLLEGVSIARNAAIKINKIGYVFIFDLPLNVLAKG